MKYSKVVYRPLMNESIFLGLEYLTCWPSCSSLDDVASLVSMLKCFLYSSWFSGGTQKFNKVIMLLRLEGSSSKLLVHQLQFKSLG